jgi:hypothetical protein
MGCEIEVRPISEAGKPTVKIETGADVPEIQRTIDTKQITEELQNLIRYINENKGRIIQMTFAKYPQGEFYIFKMLRK